MSILISADSRVLVQGITGREGAFHTERMLAAGTRVVAGVRPGKGGELVHGVPVFDTVADAVARTAADVWLAFVPARFAKAAVLEAADVGMRMLVLITEGIPVRDMVELVAELDRYGMDEIQRRGLKRAPGRDGAAGHAAAHARDADPRLRPVTLVGPNCPGVVSPGCANVGIMAADIFSPGRVGLVSRSGTLTYEIVAGLTRAGIGQSTCVGMGGDPVHGVGFIECLELFEADEQTDAVVLVGEIGGDDEERAAAFVAEHVTKPVVAYIAGFEAPAGKRMGHAGAIVSGGAGTAAAKAEALAAAGIAVARRPDEIPALAAAALAGPPTA
jgi:succinyl-CoA synthetase alpha subunit